MPKDFKPTPKRARKQPKKLDPATGKPFTAGSGSLAHLKPQRKRWVPPRTPMALDDSYDQPEAGE
jgi:hypothetical protein